MFWRLPGLPPPRRISIGGGQFRAYMCRMRLPFFHSKSKDKSGDVAAPTDLEPKKIEIFMRPTCSYSRRAIKLLESKGVAFTEINIAGDPQKKQEMITRTGGRSTVPQIFVDDIHIGNGTEIADLDAKGELNRLLGLPR